MPYFRPLPSLSLFYTLHGTSSNPPALLIHGWCADSHDWSWQIPFLAKTHYVITFDLRGHGRSSAPEDIPYTPRDFAADAAALLRHLGFTRDVFVMGHSMGAVTTSTLAVLEPSLMKAIALVDPPYFNSSEAMDAALPTVVAHTDPVEWALGVYPTLYVEDTPEWMKTWYLRRLEGTPGHVVRDCMIGLYSAGGLGRAEECRDFVVGKRTTPKLAVYWKEDDSRKERDLGMGLLDEVVTMGEVGHWMHQVKSDDFNELLGKWLDRVQKGEIIG